MAIRYNSGAAREATGLKQMPIRARTHKTGAGGMSASLIGHSGSSAFRLSTTTVSMSLTGSCFSSESAPGALVSWDYRNLLRTGFPAGALGKPQGSFSPSGSVRTSNDQKRSSDRIVELGVTGCNDSVELAFRAFMPQEWIALRCLSRRGVE